MLVDWDAPITMGDGVELRADVFLPDDGETHPVIMSLGPYAKGLAFQEGFAPMWRTLEAEHPDAVAGSSNRYQNWETADPEKWVPDGYVVIRVDSRGAGRSPGYLDILSPRETQDYYDCIEWAAVQPWSNGRVGLLGISYYAVNQWQVAALRPPHLAAICPWEGATDFYRELTHHGGILHVFLPQWYPVQVASMQHGAPDSPRHRVTGVPVTGPGVLSEEERAKNAADTVAALHDHALLDAYYRERSADLARITVPVLSAANWAHHLHTRGGFEGYAGVAERAEVAGSARAPALGRVLHGLRGRPPEALLRALPPGAGHRLGQAAAGLPQCAAGRRQLRATRRGGVAVGADPVDGVPPRPRPWRSRAGGGPR